MAEPIKYESVIPQLLQQFLGNKQTTTTSANTSGLQQVLDQQLASSTTQGMQDALTELFTQGAQQVPVLTQAMANAVGTRSGNNSGLQLSLNELNKTLTGQAAALKMQQQQAAANTAAQLANATKSSTTTTGVANGNQAALLGLGGTALNWADKLGLTDKLKTGIGSLFNSSDLSSAVDAASSPLDGFLQLNDNFSSAAGPSFMDEAASFGSGVLDAGSGFLEDAGSFIGDAAGDAVDWLGSFFADGGEVKVPPSGSQTTAAGAAMQSAGGSPDLFSCLLDAHDGVIKAASGKMKALTDIHDRKTGGGKYADGGLVAQDYADGGVVRNQNQMGGRTSTAGSSRAQNYSGYAPAASAIKPITYSDAEGKSKASSLTSGFGTTEQNSAMLGGAGMTALGLMGVPGLALAAIGALTETPNMQSQIAKQVIAQMRGDQNPRSTALAVEANSLADRMSAAGNPTDSLEAALGLTNAFGTSPADSGGGDGGMGSGSATGAGTAAGRTNDRGGYGGGSAAGGGDTGSYSNGGEIVGPGTGISDSIPARLSDGEFVLSADVVRAVGLPKLQALQAKYHTPAAVQRANGVR